MLCNHFPDLTLQTLNLAVLGIDLILTKVGWTAAASSVSMLLEFIRSCQVLLISYVLQDQSQSSLSPDQDRSQSSKCFSLCHFSCCSHILVLCFWFWLSPPHSHQGFDGALHFKHQTYSIKAFDLTMLLHSVRNCGCRSRLCALEMGCDDALMWLYSHWRSLHTANYTQCQQSLQEVAFPINNEAESKDPEIRVVFGCVAISA